MRGSHVHVQVRETRGSQAVCAFGVLRCMRLLECVFSLPQLGRARCIAQIELPGRLQIARELEQGMRGGVRGCRQRAGQGEQKSQGGQHDFQAEAFRLLRPPRSEWLPENPCDRNKPAAAALRLPVAQISR